MQVVGLNDPEALDEKPTVPVGEIGVPPLMSATVAVHVDGSPTETELGKQERDVPVNLCSTIRVDVPELPAWFASPPYVPVIVALPSDPTSGVYVTAHEPPERVQDVELKEPAPPEVNPTVPNDSIGVPGLVSVTVAVQTVGCPIGSASGLQRTAAEVERGETVTWKESWLP